MDINSISSLNSGFDLYNVKKQSQLEQDSFKAELDNALNNKDDEKLKEACVEFESYFLKVILTNMRKTTISEDGLFGKSDAEKIFQDMLDEQICNNIAKGNNGVGLSKMLYNQLSQNINK